jgi:hypothetical protein
MQSVDLEPVDTASGRLIVACFTLHHLDHKTFTAVFNTLIKECLDVLRLFAVRSRQVQNVATEALSVLTGFCAIATAYG